MLPDLDSVYICPWDRSIAIIFADLFWEGKPYNVCPRQALKRSIQNAQDKEKYDLFQSPHLVLLGFQWSLIY